MRAAAAAPRTAMVLAAGAGTRMRPLSATTPKPLVKVAGKALIDHCLDDLAAHGVERAVVNVHHLADLVEAHVKPRQQPEILISDERDALLDTGGGISRALPLIGQEPFLLRNSDSFWLNGVRANIDLLADRWDDAEMDGVLLVAEAVRSRGYRGRGDFLLDKLGRISRRPERTVAPHVYAGAAILHPRLFVDVPEGAYSLNILFDRAIATGRLYGVCLDGLWINVETLQAIALAEAAIVDSAA